MFDWFVDWLNISQQFEPSLYSDYLGGRVVSVDGLGNFSPIDISFGEDEIESGFVVSGDLEYSVSKFATHSGSHETSIQIRMENGLLQVRGNPSAYGRLDNLFGYTLDECVFIINGILKGLGLPEFTSGKVEKLWMQNEQKFVTKYTGATISRADYTRNFMVGMGNVRNFHKWILSQKFSRSSPCIEDVEQFVKWNYETVYSSVSKYFINAKFYDKGAEIEDQKLPNYVKKLNKSLGEGKINANQHYELKEKAETYLSALALWCSEVGLSRCEYSFKSRYFKQNDELGYYKENTTHSELLKHVNLEFNKIGDRAMVYQETDYLDILTPKEFLLFTEWKNGKNVKQKYPSKTFYRVRSQILEKTGFDIAAFNVGNIGNVAVSRPVYFNIKAVTSRELPSFYSLPSLAA